MLSTGLPKLGKKHEKCDPRILSRLKPRAITVDMLPRSLAASIRRMPLPKDIPAPCRTSNYKIDRIAASHVHRTCRPLCPTSALEVEAKTAIQGSIPAVPAEESHLPGAKQASQ